MSLYFEAVRFLGKPDLKSKVFADKAIKSQPSQIYALVIEASKWSTILSEIIENSSLLELERKIKPELALLLVHDLLLSKRGIAAPVSHKLRVAVEKNKVRLQAELTKARLRRGCPSLAELRQQVNSGFQSIEFKGDGSSVEVSSFDHARWVRVNRIKTTLEQELSTTFSTYEHAENVQDILTKRGQRILHVDKHVPDLIALPPGTDLAKQRSYLDGKLIIQDKASCFPAYLLDPQARDGIVVDGCAAPGNKTTHLASLRYIASDSSAELKVIACERDRSRASILQKMVSISGADELVAIKAGQDFLKVDPQSEPWCNVGALLLDPSCSGSGIVGRDDRPIAVVFPAVHGKSAPASKKRKRDAITETTVENVDETAEEKPEESVSKERLQSLSSFQIKLVLHALKFPAAHKITYSTCSIHDEENEHVVAAVLNSQTARERGWQVLKRENQVDGMKRWHLRGQQSRTDLVEVDSETADACIRCEKHTEDGTQGFFVAGFVRDATNVGGSLSDDEWTGFDD